MKWTGASTLKDVANRAGVSTKTASRVLNNHPSVAPETRASVLTAMEDLNYVPDAAARSLRVGVDRSVGVLLDSIGDIFFAELAAAIEAALHRHGYHSLIVSSNRDPGMEAEAASSFIQRRCAGMIVAPLTPDSLSAVPLSNTPVVFVDRVGSVPGAQSVVVDDVGLSQQATEHLIAHGHTRIALITDRLSMITSRDRFDGYKLAMAKHSIPVDDELVCGGVLEANEVFPALKRLFELEDPPTAILSTNSRLSLGVVPALHQFGRMDTAILSYGDFALAGSLSPAVSVIDHDPAAIGAAAVEALLPRLQGQPPSGGQTIFVPARLIPRGSGELRPRTEDPADQGGS
ncbi:MAG: LacI family DNA-binding transcriptional regulator [Propionibacteriaceae bacterium]|nr:LacI family DNA-binding transcriptional regulator [Propionibacteriaceae bacterium]